MHPVPQCKDALKPFTIMGLTGGLKEHDDLRGDLGGNLRGHLRGVPYLHSKRDHRRTGYFAKLLRWEPPPPDIGQSQDWYRTPTLSSSAFDHSSPDSK
jgi:hypothetical protein